MMSVSNQCEKSARACSPKVLSRGTPRMLDLYKNSFWSGSLMRFSKTGNYVRCALSIGLTFMNNYCFLASVWAIQERDNLGCLFQSVTDTLAVHLWDLLRGEVGGDDSRQLTLKRLLWHFLVKKRMGAWIFVRKSVPLRLVIVGMRVLICWIE